MPRGIHGRGRKHSEYAKQRMRDGHQRRRDRGLPVGGIKIYPQQRFICAICGAFIVEYYGWKKRVVCSNACQRAYNIKTRKPKRKYPPDDVLRDDYLAGATLDEIAKKHNMRIDSIRSALIRTNTSRRNESDFQLKICKVTGCQEPVHLIYHTVHKKWHGTECEHHFKERRTQWQQRMWPVIKEKRRIKKLKLVN